jgi:hypothetical protein
LAKPSWKKSQAATPPSRQEKFESRRRRLAPKEMNMTTQTTLMPNVPDLAAIRAQRLETIIIDGIDRALLAQSTLVMRCRTQGWETLAQKIESDDLERFYDEPLKQAINELVEREAVFPDQTSIP